MKNIYAIIIVLVLLGLSAFFLYKGVKKEEKSEERKFGKHFEALLKEREKKASQLFRADDGNTPTSSPTMSAGFSPALKNLLKDLGQTWCKRDFTENSIIKYGKLAKDIGMQQRINNKGGDIDENSTIGIISSDLMVYIISTGNLSEFDKKDYLCSLQLAQTGNQTEITLDGDNIIISDNVVNRFPKYLSKTMNKYDFADSLYKIVKNIHTNSTECKKILNIDNKDDEIVLVCDYYNNLTKKIKDKNLCEYIVN